MKSSDIVSFVREHIEPLPALPPDGKRYRVSAKLNDGTVLPCVVIKSASLRIDNAIRRLDEAYKSTDKYMGYRAMVRLFAAAGNTINDYDLKSIAPCPFAIPVSRMSEIGGETSMGWTAFYAHMVDGAEFHFGTQFLTEFFEMPDGYSADDITRIIPAARSEEPRHKRTYRERPFFDCFVDGL